MQEKGIKQRVKILKILTKGNFVSGQYIADACNISRIAVWKHINHLISKGVKIKTHPNKGYEFISFGNRLIPEIIRLYLGPEKFVKEIVYFDEVDSTNNVAKKILKEGSLIVAEQQKKGKGRSGKIWKSEKYKDILFSLIISPYLPYYYLPIFNIIGALSVALALNKSFKGVKAKVKWPNDVLINGKKISGVLVELFAEVDLIEKLIIGIGVDINSKPKLSNATSLITILKDEKLDRAKLLVQIISELNKLYEMAKRNNLKQIQKIWNKNSLDYKRKVKIVQNGNIITGLSQGIDNCGNLIIRKGRKEISVYPTSSLKII
ncbi:MAG: biotin--[acetyl-CoA-carboxylase] ligase [Candidatus Saelkia tenebricola]|nr:biotin--[acetyl-CoA-carboxylase] ligase [Candidatus Saelkia tenebricola]